jgi:hypothetical protein
MAFRIGRNFHVIHMTDDLRELDGWYYDIFSVHRYMPDSYGSAEVRDASLVLLGDLCIEPLAPAFRMEGWNDMPLGRYYRRHGRRLHSLAWYVDEGLDDLFHDLIGAGVRCYGTGGVKLDGSESMLALFTHPRDTCTQLEFVDTKVASMLQDPRFRPDWNPAWWADRHPLHVRKFSHATVTTRDVNRALEVYVGVLKGRLIHEGDVGSHGSRSAFVLVGDDLIVELAQPAHESSPLAHDMQRYHESLYSLTYKVADLEEAEEYLARKGVKFSVSNGTVLVSDPATTQGCVMEFSALDVPGDPRPDWGEQA